jgi:hypothetical protein
MFRVLENVKEIWTEVPKSGKGKAKPVSIRKMFIKKNQPADISF